MVVLITSLASVTRISLDGPRVRATAARCGKPMTVWTYTLPSEFGRAGAAGCGLFVHSDLRNVGVAMSKLAGYAEALARPIPEPPVLADVAPLPPDLPRVLPEYAAKHALAPFLPPSAEALATTAAEAAEAAAALGFPVALKIQSPDLPHKTEAGGVRLGLADAAAVRPAYDAMMRDVLAHMPDARIDGVAVQKMAPKGHELVIGMVNDPTFGPIMMVGFGGVTVELFGDVAAQPGPGRCRRGGTHDPLAAVSATAYRVPRQQADRPGAGGDADRAAIGSGVGLCGPHRRDGVQSGDSAR